MTTRPYKPRDSARSVLLTAVHDRLTGLALSQDFRKFAKKSKAGADQEKFSKMAGAAGKKSLFFGLPPPRCPRCPGARHCNLCKSWFLGTYPRAAHTRHLPVKHHELPHSPAVSELPRARWGARPLVPSRVPRLAEHCQRGAVQP